MQICETQTYQMRVITFYGDSAAAVSPGGPTMVETKRDSNVFVK